MPCIFCGRNAIANAAVSPEPEDQPLCAFHLLTGFPEQFGQAFLELVETALEAT